MLLLLIFLASGSVVCGENLRPRTKVPDDALFKDQAAFCEGCYAVVTELDNLLTQWRQESGALEDHIDAALLALCTTDRLRSYVLSPPKMTRLCAGIRGHYLDELGMAFTKKYSRKDTMTSQQVFEETCRKAIPACPNGTKPMSVARQENREKAERETREKEREEKKMDKKNEKKSNKNKDKKKKGKKDEL